MFEPVFRLVRVVRTTSSEVYMVWEGEQRVGQVDLHYPLQHREPLIHGTVILETALTEAEIESLLTQLDEDIVSAHLPHFDRQDFLITVYRGQEINQYNDSRTTENE